MIYRGNCKGAHLPSVLEAFGGYEKVGSGSLSPDFTVLIRRRVLRTVHLGSMDQPPEADFQTLHANIKTNTKLQKFQDPSVSPMVPHHILMHRVTNFI